MYADRLPFYRQLETSRGSRVLVYFTGDRRKMETQIHSEITHFFADHLDKFSSPEKISLVLYSRGGDTLAGWTIVNMIRQFCDRFEVIIPSKAHSTATLIALGSGKIMMTKQATLGPIDPSVNSPLNPQVPGAPPNARLPISVEAVAGYFELAKYLDIKREDNLTSIYLKLVEHVHPVALGNVYRARTQIQMLAEKLLKFHMKDDDKIKKIISILCSESGSHDYTINRKEALNDLALPIEKPNDALYAVISGIFNNIRQELELDNPFDPNTIIGNSPNAAYACTRALIESVSGGSHRFISEGNLSRSQVPTPAGMQETIVDRRTFEGWRHESA